MREKITALLLMAGTGMRFKSEFPKQFHLLAGKKVYLHTLEAFLQCSLFHKILLVCHPRWLDEVTEELRTYPNFVHTIPGGQTRQESSFLGLQSCEETDYVVIHDAVRPFVSREIIKNNVEQVRIHKAVDTCIPSSDTLVRTKERGWIAEIPDRAEYMRGQTPQSFAHPLILEAHAQTRLTNSTDDCRLVLEKGHPIKIVLGEEINFKLTTANDLMIAEKILSEKSLRI
jgi:ribitol-5-phosphate 2-dehydrogenase (NADP+) / D-ribitol-5-phosphate cytidylyltransferase